MGKNLGHCENSGVKLHRYTVIEHIDPLWNAEAYTRSSNLTVPQCTMLVGKPSLTTQTICVNTTRISQSGFDFNYYKV